jgi:hypothetical protein
VATRLATLLSILRGRQQPAASKDEPELARAAFDARKPSERAERRPAPQRESR